MSLPQLRRRVTEAGKIEVRRHADIRIVETDGRPQRVVLTSGGMAAIGVEQEDGGQTTAPAEADTASTPAEAVTAVETPAPATEANGASTPAKRKAKAKATKAKAAKPGKTAPTEKPTPRAGTKQAQMIEMLKRPEGATVEQIAAATGWQHHTILGAITGALKKKLGLTVEATRTREIGPEEDRRQGQQHRLPDRRTGLIPPPQPGSYAAAGASRPAAISFRSFGRRQHPVARDVL